MRIIRDRDDINTLAQLIDDAGLDRKWYSGRNMDGIECLGIESPDSVFSVISDLINATQGDLELIEPLADAVREIKTDNLGLNTIVYFPSYRSTDR